MELSGQQNSFYRFVDNDKKILLASSRRIRIIAAMDAHTQVREALQTLGQAAWRDVSAKSGVPYGTLYKVGYGYSKNPRFSTIERVARVLLKRKPVKS